MAQVQIQKQVADGRHVDNLDDSLSIRSVDAEDTSLATEAECDDAHMSTPLEYSVYTIPADYTLETLYNKWLNKDITVPKFERRYVWTEAQASRLIESFIMDLPVPAVFLSTSDDGRSIIIDGMQRLLTVFSYFGGSYPEASALGGRRFRIIGINEDSRLYGKTFFELGEDDQRRLKDAILRATLVRRNGARDGGDSSIYEIFERLNTGGTQLEAQEVRNCVYEGGLNDLLGEMNKDANWRAILGKPKPDPRMRDRELILRYIALFHEGDEYTQPMKGFLSEFMSKHKSPDEKFLESERQRFEVACSATLAALGPKPFNNSRGQLRIPLFDSVLVAFARSGDVAGRPSSMKKRLKALRSNKRFVDYAGPSSTTTSAVKGRLRLAQEIMFE